VDDATAENKVEWLRNETKARHLPLRTVTHRLDRFDPICLYNPTHPNWIHLSRLMHCFLVLKDVSAVLNGFGSANVTESFFCSKVLIMGI
jgi:hypothetical protein